MKNKNLKIFLDEYPSLKILKIENPIKKKQLYCYGIWLDERTRSNIYLLCSSKMNLRENNMNCIRMFSLDLKDHHEVKAMDVENNQIFELKNEIVFNEKTKTLILYAQ